MGDKIGTGESRYTRFRYLCFRISAVYFSIMKSINILSTAKF
jgi:hypothetical protein